MLMKHAFLFLTKKNITLMLILYYRVFFVVVICGVLYILKEASFPRKNGNRFPRKKKEDIFFPPKIFSAICESFITRTPKLMFIKTTHNINIKQYKD